MLPSNITQSLVIHNFGQFLNLFTNLTRLAFGGHFDYTLFMSVTYQPKKRKRAKTHGFLVRKKTAAGKTVLKRRMQKGRARLAV